MEEAEAAVIGGQLGHVLVDLLAVDLAGKQIEIGRMGLDERFQPGGTDELVADEVHPEDPLPRSFVDDEHGPQIARLVALQDGDADLAIALVLVVFFNLAAAVFHGEGIGRVAHLEFGLFLEDRGQVGVVADDDDFLQQRTLDHLEDDDDPARHPLIEGPDTEAKTPILLELANVLLDLLLDVGPAGTGADLRQDLVEADRPVAFHANLDHHLFRRHGRRHGGRRADIGAGQWAWRGRGQAWRGRRQAWAWWGRQRASAARRAPASGLSGGICPKPTDHPGPSAPASAHSTTRRHLPAVIGGPAMKALSRRTNAASLEIRGQRRWLIR